MQVTLILERLRELHHIIKRSEIFKSPTSNENKVLLQLKEIQLRLRCGETCNVEDCVRPFLSVLSLPSLTSPYMICALEALKAFLRLGLLDTTSPNTVVISQIVFSIIGCKFVSTDVTLDSRCYFECVQSLAMIISEVPNIEYYECYEHIVQHLLAVVDGTKAIEHLSSQPIVIAAQEALIVAARRVSLRISTISADLWQPIHDCWLRWIRYCLSVLQTRRRRVWFDEYSQNVPPKKFVHEQPTNYQCSNVVMCLKMMKYLVVDVVTSKQFSTLLHRSDVFQMLIIEVGFSIVDVALSEISADEFRALMHFAVAVMSTKSNEWLPFIHHFISQVFINKLSLFFHLLQKQIGADHPFSAFCNNQHSTQEFNPLQLEFLEIATEGMTDFISNNNILVTLFTVFDCDFSAQEIVRPLIGLIAQSSSLVLTTGTERLGELKDIGIAVVQSFKQVVHSIGRTLSSESNASINNDIDPRIFAISGHAVHVLAAEKFCNKPSQCFKFLYQENILHEPVCAKSVATYLRHAPLLPKDKVGSYLGEIGKSDTDCIFDSIEFHKKVLSEYVSTFDLHGLDVLSCLRIFLGAFRLPGEAQQIDRILIAFSEHCHLHSKDSLLGIVENADVTYLLLFSIIMLNTDRHNPNIRPERKMTLEQFVRNNLCYGKDVNQSRPIPRNYLEKIFASIEEFPIRTEAREFIGVFTIEEWIDELYGKRLFMLSSPTQSNAQHFGLSTQSLKALENFLRHVAEYMLLPGLSVHLYNMLLFENSTTMSQTSEVANWWKERTGRLLDLSCDFLQEVLQLCGKLHCNDMIDSAISMLYEICFLKESQFCHGFTEVCFVSVSFEKNVLLMSKNIFSKTTFPNVVFYERLARPSMQRALISLVTIISSFADQLVHWDVVISVLTQLRDFALLPKTMVDFGEDELLPNSIRCRFEQTWKPLGDVPNESRTSDLSSSRKMSAFQYLGEAIFGSTSSVNESDPSPFDLHFRNINKMNATVLCGYNNEIHPMWQESTRNLRIAIEKTALPSLISESKFLSDGTLNMFLRNIISAVECKLKICSSALSDHSLHQNLQSEASHRVFGWIDPRSYSLDFSTIISFSSAAWLEAVVIEVLLRNRDRFSICWPVVELHFRTTLLDNHHSISRNAEIQLNGFLKLSGRLLARESCQNMLIEFLGKLCGVHQAVGSSACFNKVADLNPTIMTLVNQLMAGIWRLLTHNVETLPKFSLHQWEILFSIIAAGSVCTDFAAYKAFEIMAWLLQEPRLVANIPVFSVVAIKPLITNTNSHSFVSEGAVLLTMYVMSRLEPVFQQAVKSVDYMSDDDDDGLEQSLDSAALIWKTCWIPILQAVFTGCYDDRSRVRLLSLSSVCKIFRSGHITCVPNRLLIDVMVQKFLPASHMLLRDFHKLSVPNVDEFIVEEHPDFSPTFEDVTFGFIHKGRSDLKAETVLLETVTTVEEFLLKNSSKLSAHPAFDKLWLEALTFLVSSFEGCRSLGNFRMHEIVSCSIRRLYNMLESSLTQKIGLKAVTLGYIATILDENTL